MPRFLLTLRRMRRTFEGMGYDWKRAIRQDLSTITGLLMGLTLLPLWRTYFLDGTDAAKLVAPRAVTLALGVGVFYGVLHHLKKTGRLH